MAADAGDPEHVLEAWRAGRVERRDLYTAVRDAMYQGVRRGIWFITSTAPNEQDIEDVVYESFCELQRQDPRAVRTSIGFAAHLARQRGRDRGRAIIREREKVHKLGVDLADRAHQAELVFGDLDAQMAEQRAVVAGLAVQCLDTLTAEQRAVVEETIMRPVSLSDWAVRAGKTHQAASRQRLRAIDSVRRCVDRKLREREEGKEDRGE